jgi:hypothetical protein
MCNRGYKHLTDTKRIWKRGDTFVHFDKMRVIEKESHKDFNTAEEMLKYIDKGRYKR